MTLNSVTASICDGIYALVYFVVRVRCHCEVSLRALPHLLMSFLYKEFEIRGKRKFIVLDVCQKLSKYKNSLTKLLQKIKRCSFILMLDKTQFIDTESAFCHNMP